MTTYEQMTATLKAMQRCAENLQEAVNIILAGTPTHAVSYLTGSNGPRFRLRAGEDGWELAQESQTIPESAFHTRTSPNNLKYWLAPARQYQFAAHLHELLAYQIRGEEEHILQTIQQGAQFFGSLQPDIKIEQIYRVHPGSGRRALLEELRLFSSSAQQRLLVQIYVLMQRAEWRDLLGRPPTQSTQLNPEIVTQVLEDLRLL